MAHKLLTDAFRTDVRPLLAQVREEMGVPVDPIAAYRACGYEEKMRKERGASPSQRRLPIIARQQPKLQQPMIATSMHTYILYKDTSSPVLEMQHISKRFDATQALEDVSLALYPGEVHALIGENGAGKSTLIKIMTGVHRPDTGTILLDGKPVQISNSQEAQTLGIAAIYQEPMVFPDLNVAENIFISHRNRGMVVNRGKMVREAEAILAQLDVKLDVRMPARGLTLAAQQAVEIAKAISLKVRVLIMDEPTASLSAHEVDQLFRLVNSLRSQGVAVLFIGHRMEEVFRIADRVTVLRDGKWISSRPRSEVNRDQVIREMVGREVGDFFAKTQVERGPLLMSVSGLGKEGVFSGVSFDVHQGEVLGFAGPDRRPAHRRRPGPLRYRARRHRFHHV